MMSAKNAATKAMAKEKTINDEQYAALAKKASEAVDKMIEQGHTEVDVGVEDFDTQVVGNFAEDVRTKGWKTCLVEKENNLDLVWLRLSCHHMTEAVSAENSKKDT